MERPSKKQPEVIIYDKSCPMCRAYTAGFVNVGALDKEGRVDFTELYTAEGCPLHEEVPAIDLDRARNEIPLVDSETGQIRYGLDALFHLLRKRWPILRLVLRPALRVLLKPLYWLITYNRRVIAGSGHKNDGFDCAPDINPFWRLTWILIALTVSGIALDAFVRHSAFAEIPIACPVSLGFAAGIFGQAFLALMILKGASRWDYLGNWSTSILIGGFGLLAILAMGLSGLWLGVVFAMLAAFVVVIHERRASMLGLPIGMTLAAVLIAGIGTSLAWLAY